MCRLGWDTDLTLRQTLQVGRVVPRGVAGALDAPGALGGVRPGGGPAAGAGRPGRPARRQVVVRARPVSPAPTRTWLQSSLSSEYSFRSFGVPQSSYPSPPVSLVPLDHPPPSPQCRNNVEAGCDTA